MYVTGTQFNLQNRLHQLAINSADVAQYEAEFNSYTFTDFHAAKRIEKELEKIKETLETD